MSDVKSPNSIGMETVFLLPSQILTNPRHNVRPFSSESTDTEDDFIERLAATIERDGQMDALVITPGHELIAGHRRRKAVMVINERRSARGCSLLKLRCAVDATGGDLKRKAIISNLHRKANSAMDLAYLITQIRQEHQWVGYPGALKVADYLGVDVTTIRQHEKFLSAEKDLQNRIHNGTISAQSAFDLMNNLKSPADRSEAVIRAAEIQAEDKLEKTLENYRTGAVSLDKTTDELRREPGKRIEHPAIVKAIRERHTVTSHTTGRHKLTRSRAELINSIAQFDSDDYSDAARGFARYWANTYSMGIGTTAELQAKFRAIMPAPNQAQSQAQSQTPLPNSVAS